MALWEIDEDNVERAPAEMIVLDDVIFSGAQFKAAQLLLSERFPTAEIVGVFIARGVAIDDDALFDADPR